MVSALKSRFYTYNGHYLDTKILPKNVLLKNKARQRIYEKMERNGVAARMIQLLSGFPAGA